jgi:LmbE family N-acetylglucosaminyl deacetylase
MINQPSSVLVLAPHTDDAELGAGGTIARFAAQGLSVSVAAFSTCAQSLPPELPPDTLRWEFERAMPVLGVPVENLHVYDFMVRRLLDHRQEVLEELVRLRSLLRPDIVLLPSKNDMHQDHQVLHAEGLRAFKQCTVLGYELPWNHISFDAQAFFMLEDLHVQRKCDALMHYRSQMLKGRGYFDSDFIRSWARFRGQQIGSNFAEAFEVYRIRT